jgi:glycine dehydrogenase subunit 2
MTAFHGQMGMYVRALAYMLSHGSDGMKQASEDAVLNANYIRAGLADLMSLPFGNKPCMHEVLFDDAWLKDTGVTTLDYAKAMIDEGYHPMTVYFPLVVHGALLIEPTESESKASLDLFVATLRDLAMSAKAGETERFTARPITPPPAPRRDPRRPQPRAALDPAEASGRSSRMIVPLPSGRGPSHRRFRRRAAPRRRAGHACAPRLPWRLHP